ncbi:hypothetical protein Hanom_Chr09g00804191 [Helianthus anomalus]
MRKNKPLDESRKTGQTSGTKMTFYSTKNIQLKPSAYNLFLQLNDSKTNWFSDPVYCNYLLFKLDPHMVPSERCIFPCHKWRLACVPMVNGFFFGAYR